ncbi:hypothetical protein [Streptomyces virginiae]|uniref:hypothetical protein n=1 Tax=Streptomyces virginiae TaxID=1961 RepID=UPI00224C8FB8|nr:hypothetical protein [Streptomyces virginiae]MCX4959766.1 hypothetical protein [Streptomyces virginiae]MCX5178596.1 hypothetical protein [Streptomyces virginiae]
MTRELVGEGDLLTVRRVHSAQGRTAGEPLMATPVNTRPPALAEAEHPLVAVLNIFAPGIANGLGGTERETEDDARFVPYDAVARRLARLGLS